MASTYPRWQGDHEPGFVHELCKRLAANLDVVVLTPRAPGTRAEEVMDAVRVLRFRYAPRRLETLVHDGGMVANLRTHPWKWLLVPGFLCGLLHAAVSRMRRDHFDALHAHWIIPQGVIAAIAAAMLGRRCPPLLLTVHGGDLYAFRGRLMRRLKQAVVNRAAVVTVVSAAMRDDVGALAKADVTVLVKPMGVDLAAFRPEPGVERATSELLFVGRLVEKKGLRHLLDALPEIAAAVPDVRLTVAGFGPQERALREQADRLGLAGRVTFLGAVRQSELPRLYRRAAALVAPFVEARSGDRDGLGLVLVEALGCGCPVVTTAIPAVRDVFEGAWPEYCAQPGDPRSIAREVLRLLGDPESARDNASGSAAALRKKFDWDVVAGGYAGLLGALHETRQT
jgi:glycosyltransferase involved in cell wall biosynthesis